MKYTKVLIIGAPRSGTNMLRNILVENKSFATWPCDEINYIWRYGKAREPYDELKKEDLNKNIKKYIINAFDEIANKHNADFVVEKTCANSLRIPYVNQIVPDAKYIFIRRNGFDAISSAFKKWQSSPNLRYIFKKAKFVPLKDIPLYSSKYLFNNLYKLISKEKRMGFWGPKFQNFEKILSKYSLIETVAFQWQECINKAYNDLRKDSRINFIEIDYDDFVMKPYKNLSQIYEFLGIYENDKEINKSIKLVKETSMGLGLRSLQTKQIELIKPIINKTMKSFNYKI